MDGYVRAGPRKRGVNANVNRTVLGVIGRMGAGKDELCRRIHERCGTPILSAGDIARGIARRRGQRETREVLRAISQELFAQHGPGYFIDRLIAEIDSNRLPSAVLNGVRTPSDVDRLGTAFGKGFRLIHVAVPDPRLRFERLQHRDEARDPGSYDEFLDEERETRRLFRMEEAIERADLTIVNSGTRDDLHRQVDRAVIEEILRPRGACDETIGEGGGIPG